MSPANMMRAFGSPAKFLSGEPIDQIPHKQDLADGRVKR